MLVAAVNSKRSIGRHEPLKAGAAPSCLGDAGRNLSKGESLAVAGPMGGGWHADICVVHVPTQAKNHMTQKFKHTHTHTSTHTHTRTPASGPLPPRKGTTKGRKSSAGSRLNMQAAPLVLPPGCGLSGVPLALGPFRS